MPLSLTQTTLVRIVAGQAITNNLLRLLALSPSVSISGSVAASDLADGAVTAVKSTPGAYWYAADSTNTNTYAGTFNPAVSAYANGLQLFLKVTNANTAAAAPSLNANALGVKNIYHRGGLAPKAGDLVANSILHLVYNSSLNGGSGGFEIYGITPSATLRPASNDTAGSATAQTVVNTPPLTAYTSGVLLLVKVGSGLTNTGALTLNCDSLGARDVLRPGGAALAAGDWLAAQTYLLYDDGTQFILLTRERTVTAVVASSRKLEIASTATIVTVTADEVVLKYGGAVASPVITNGSPLLVSGVSITMDITGGVALNSFETGGSRSTNHWYYIWLISNGTSVRGVFEDAGAGDGALPAGPDLSGAPFAGYVYLALVGQTRLNAIGAGENVVFTQYDRQVFTIEQVVLTAKAAAANDTWEVLAAGDLTALRAAVPPTARSCGGFAGSDNVTDMAALLLSGTNGSGNKDANNHVGLKLINLPLATVYTSATEPGPAQASGCTAPFVDLPVRGGVSRNIQWKSRLTTLSVNLSISSYTF